jgi:tetratricopeptide (TPR) repeat protein
MRVRAYLAAWLVAAVVAASLRAQTAAQARGTVRDATRAVESDSATALVAGWTRALDRDPYDRIAALGLATVARLSLRYDEANARYRPLLPQSGARPDAVNAYARLGEALVLAAQSAPGPGDTAFAGAAATAQAVGDSAAIVEALIGWAEMRAHSQSEAAGAAVLRRANRFIPRANPSLLALYQCEQASIGAAPAGADSRAKARSGAVLAREAGDRAIEAKCRFELGRELMRVGDMAAAVAVFDSTERQVVGPRDRGGLARLRQYRAFAEEQMGDYSGALRSVRLAIANGETSHNPPVIAYAKMTQGKVYLELGDVAAAARAVDGAAAVFGQAGDEIGRLSALSVRGQIALAAGDLAGARAVSELEQHRAAQIGDAGYVADGEQALADVATRERQWGVAARWLRAVSATVHHSRARGWESDVLFANGVLALRAGRLRDAERDVSAASRALNPARHRDRYVTASVLAEIHLGRGDTARAERELTTASDELDQWRSTLEDRDVRMLAFQYQSSFGGPGPGVAKVIAAVARSGRTAAAFELAERRRARDLADQLERAAAGPAASAGAITAARPVALDWAPTPGPTASALEALQQALPDDQTALLEYVTGPGDAPTTLFAVTRGTARTYFLAPSDTMADAIHRFIALVESGADISAPAQVLGSMLVGSALADLGTGVSRLVIVADGVLHRTPFAALRLPGGGYLVERYAIAAAPSALVAVRLSRRPSTTLPPSVLAFGDPRFPGEKAGAADAETYRSAFNETGGLPRLAGSATEARLVARFGTGSIVRLRDSASASYLKRAVLDSFRVIHLATHAIVDDRAATRTALALAGGPGESGFVTPADLAALRLRADLVVLSACRTAGGRIVAGEGVRGLTAPLLAAGARAIVASQWAIGDRRTVRLVHDLYRALADGRPAADALREAELASLRRGAPAREWAAFTLTGDPMVRVPLTVPRFDWLWRMVH